MKTSCPKELTAAQIAEMDRDELINQLLDFPGTFKFDLTVEYLQRLSREQLQHVLMAAYLNAYRR